MPPSNPRHAHGLGACQRSHPRGTVQRGMLLAGILLVGFSTLPMLSRAELPHAQAGSAAHASRPQDAPESPEATRRAPACELSSLANDRASDDASGTAESGLRMRRFEGRVHLVDFWASWCRACQQMFEVLNALEQEFGDRGFSVLAVNLDANPRDALEFVAERNVTFEVVRDARGRCPREFGLVGMPTAYLIDATGSVRKVIRGFRRNEALALREAVEALLPPTANQEATEREPDDSIASALPIDPS